MTKIYSPEELTSFSRETLVAVILSMQDQLTQLNTNMERLIEQIASANNHRYGRSSEKLEQIGGRKSRAEVPLLTFDKLIRRGSSVSYSSVVNAVHTA